MYNRKKKNSITTHVHMYIMYKNSDMYVLKY